MRTTTNHSGSPRDLVTCLHSRRSCASRSWIGHKVCAPLDGGWLDTLFLLLRGFPFCRLLCLLQPLFIFRIVCQFLSVVFSHCALPQLWTVCNMYELLPLGNQLPTSFKGFANMVKCWWSTLSRQVGLSTSLSSSKRWTHANDRM